MDCFYAAIEIKHRPELANLPVAVGGESGRRGVLCTCNYIARSYGVRSAMPTFLAKKRCPDLIVLPPQFELYRKESQAIREIFSRYADLIEPLSLDEAYLDVSDSEYHRGSATLIAQAILGLIHQERQLTASAGVANNKLIAKIASDENKPNGMYVVTPNEVEQFIKPMPVEKLFGVGPKMAEKLSHMGIETCQDLQAVSLQVLSQQFGKMGVSLYQYCRGIDNRAVISSRPRKSLSVEWTFNQDIEDEQAIKQAVKVLYGRLIKRWSLAGEPKFKKGYIKIKDNNFKVYSFEQAMFSCSLDIYILMMDRLFQKHKTPIRLIGLGFKLEQACVLGQMEFDFEENTYIEKNLSD